MKGSRRPLYGRRAFISQILIWSTSRGGGGGGRVGVGSDRGCIFMAFLVAEQWVWPATETGAAQLDGDRGDDDVKMLCQSAWIILRMTRDPTNWGPSTRLG